MTRVRFWRCGSHYEFEARGHAGYLGLRGYGHHAHDVGAELHRTFKIQRNIHQEGVHIAAAARFGLSIQTHLCQLWVHQVIELIAAFRVILHNAAQKILVHAAVIAECLGAESGHQITGQLTRLLQLCYSGVTIKKFHTCTAHFTQHFHHGGLARGNASCYYNNLHAAHSITLARALQAQSVCAGMQKS